MNTKRWASAALLGSALLYAIPSLASEGAALSPFVINLTVFVLAIFVGYYVVWNVTPALHTPLMSLTNAISGIIIIGALLSAAPDGWTPGTFMGTVAIVLASICIFAGFMVTQRMLAMFKTKKKGSRGL
ncbi:MAG: NAD(P) transhydrogenase subunit alpha [Pseudomonadales bacterium]|nr:NAD(P) transhydrogenase subunit alpha [Pseudomonadales bacterium]